MRVWRRFLSHWQNWLGLLLVVGFVFVAIAAPVLSPEDPDNPGPIKSIGRATDHRPRPPSEEAPLGTLPGQISIYHSLVWGTRSAVSFGLAVTAFTAVVGVLIGTTSAYFGGLYNDLMMRFTDAFLAFPVIAGVVLIQQLVSITLYTAGARLYMTGMGSFTHLSPGTIYLPEEPSLFLVFLFNLNPVMIAFILFSWMPYARMMNTVVMQIKQTEYVQAARALGAGHARLIFRHLIPNAIAPVIVLAARDVGGMVLLQATFTFIGLGGDSLWGMLLVRGRDWIIGPGGNILAYWWVFVPATLALVLFGVAWNLLGDGLNDVLNPRTH
jgi:peptide/nickel transport system permease protein